MKLLARTTVWLLLSVSAALASSHGTTSYLGQVATRSNIPEAFSAGSQEMQTRTTHFARQTLTSLQIVIPNWWVNVNNGFGNQQTEQPTGAPATVTASVEYPAGVFTQILFSGSSSGTIASGATMISDAVIVAIPNAATFFIRIHYANTVGLPKIVYTANGMMASDGFVVGATTPDLTMGGTVTAATTTGFFPAAIIAQTTNPAICIWGDSRWQGLLDTADATGDLGEVARSVGPAYPYINMSASGDEMMFVLLSYKSRFALTQYCTVVLTNNGANDLSNNQTAAQLAASTSAFIALFNPRTPVWITTLPQQSTSTDAWTTIANQTTGSINAALVTFNTNVRSCLSGTIVGMRGCMDISSVVESSLNSGKWFIKSGPIAITPDGIHENQAGALLIQSSGIIPLASFVR